MIFSTESLCDHMAVAVTGLDLNRLPDAVTQAALRDTLNRSLVLCIRGQKLAPPAFRDAMARFGTPMLRKQLTRTEECAEVSIISSEDRDVLGDGKKLVNGASWHTDDSFMREPCSLTMLYGVLVPSRGGDTQFTNMHAAYEALSPEMKQRIAGLGLVPVDLGSIEDIQQYMAADRAKWRDAVRRAGLEGSQQAVLCYGVGCHVQFWVKRVTMRKRCMKCPVLALKRPAKRAQ